MASGHAAPHQQAGHMAAPTSLAPSFQKTLANGEPSTHGPVSARRRGSAGTEGIQLSRSCDIQRINTQVFRRSRFFETKPQTPLTLDVTNFPAGEINAKASLCNKKLQGV
jgi:hypothetical protein